MYDEKLTRMITEAVTKEIKGKVAYDNIGLKVAKRLAEVVEGEAKRLGVNAVVAVSDTSARPILVECMDDAFIASYDVALNKAYTVVALKMSTIKLKPLAQPGGSLYGIQFTNDGQIVIFGGGDPLVYKGKIIGGLGVSGGTEQQDTALSKFGVSQIEKIIDEIYNTEK